MLGPAREPGLRRRCRSASRRGLMGSRASIGTSTGASVRTRTVSAARALALLWPKPARGQPRPSSPGEHAHLSELVALLGRGVAVGALPQAAAVAARRAGFALELWTVPGAEGTGRDYWVVREPAGQRRGVGCYVFRAGCAGAGAAHGPGTRALIVQAPHAYFEFGTGALAAEAMFLFGGLLSPPPLALMGNSLHRNRGRQGEEHAASEPADGDAGARAPGQRVRGFGPADVCHQRAHPFQTATAALAELGPAVFVQVHGFAGAGERSGRERYPDLVVSAGERAASRPTSTALAREFAAQLEGVRVRRYPEEFSALGATTNVQGRLLRGRAGIDFVHLEHSASLRRALLASDELRQRWVRALGAAVGAGS